MIAVADTSPISALIRIGRLSLLGRLFEQVLVPPQVAIELEEGAAIFGDWRQAEGAEVISIRPAADQLMTRELSATLHAGEAAAVALAAEISDSILLLDELEGRRVAARLGSAIRGPSGASLPRESRDTLPPSGHSSKTFARRPSSGSATN